MIFMVPCSLVERECSSLVIGPPRRRNLLDLPIQTRTMAVTNEQQTTNVPSPSSAFRWSFSRTEGVVRVDRCPAQRRGAAGAAAAGPLLGGDEPAAAPRHPSAGARPGAKGRPGSAAMA